MGGRDRDYRTEGRSSRMDRESDADRGDRDSDRRHHYRDRWSDLDDDRGRRRVKICVSMRTVTSIAATGNHGKWQKMTIFSQVRRAPRGLTWFGLGGRLRRVFGKARPRAERHQAAVFLCFNHPRQCGEEALRILVTGGPLVRGG